MVVRVGFWFVEMDFPVTGQQWEIKWLSDSIYAWQHIVQVPERDGEGRQFAGMDEKKEGNEPEANEKDKGIK